jgi:hypothetical protein
VFVRFAQERFHQFKFLNNMQFSNVCNMPPIRRNLHEQLALSLSRRTDCDPKGIRHDGRARLTFCLIRWFTWTANHFDFVALGARHQKTFYRIVLGYSL